MYVGAWLCVYVRWMQPKRKETSGELQGQAGNGKERKRENGRDSAGAFKDAAPPPWRHTPEAH